MFHRLIQSCFRVQISDKLPYPIILHKLFYVHVLCIPTRRYCLFEFFPSILLIWINFAFTWHGRHWRESIYSDPLSLCPLRQPAGQGHQVTDQLVGGCAMRAVEVQSSRPGQSTGHKSLERHGSMALDEMMTCACVDPLAFVFLRRDERCDAATGSSLV
jgi:hypothetical protein